MLFWFLYLCNLFFCLELLLVVVVVAEVVVVVVVLVEINMYTP